MWTDLILRAEIAQQSGHSLESDMCSSRQRFGTAELHLSLNSCCYVQVVRKFNQRNQILLTARLLR
jgi:hypothetical protein